MIPARFLALDREAILAGGLVFQEAESGPAQAAEILRAVPFADPTRVFLKRDVELPMQLVFDPPMPAHGFSEFLGG